jgi:hypothetical protein
MWSYTESFSKFAGCSLIEKHNARVLRLEDNEVPEAVKELHKEVKQLVKKFHAFYRVPSGSSVASSSAASAASPASH